MFTSAFTACLNCTAGSNITKTDAAVSGRVLLSKKLPNFSSWLWLEVLKCSFSTPALLSEQQQKSFHIGQVGVPFSSDSAEVMRWCSSGFIQTNKVHCSEAFFVFYGSTKSKTPTGENSFNDSGYQLPLLSRFVLQALHVLTQTCGLCVSSSTWLVVDYSSQTHCQLMIKKCTINIFILVIWWTGSI